MGLVRARLDSILLRLGGLFVDQSAEKIDRESSMRDEADIDGPIYEFLCLVGFALAGNAQLFRPLYRERTPEVFEPTPSDAPVPRVDLDMDVADQNAVQTPAVPLVREVQGGRCRFADGVLAHVRAPGGPSGPT
jgi:hypothetical protein